jgi:ABC-type sugar transport system ATPase subunit
MQLRFDHVTKQFGDATALDIPSLTIHPGEFFSFVGPAGAGKSTALRLIAGVEAPSAGTLALGDRVLDSADGSSADVRVVPADAVLRPGDQPFSLFDDPLIGLDGSERIETREKLRKLHQELGTTFIYATEDQEEALALSDRIAVLHEGRLHQVGTPSAVFDHPRTTAVASFFGSPPMNVVPGILQKDCVAVEIGPRVVELNGAVVQTYARDVFLGIRPENIRLRTGSTNGWKAAVSSVTPVENGATIEVTVDMGRFVAREEGEVRHQVGDTVLLTLPGKHLHVFDERGVRLDVV